MARTNIIGLGGREPGPWMLLKSQFRPDFTGRKVRRIQFVRAGTRRQEPYMHRPFADLNERADLISLEEARNTPPIVYHSIGGLLERPQGFQFTLLPLSIANARDDVKYRMESFEWKEHNYF